MNILRISGWRSSLAERGDEPSSLVTWPILLFAGLVVALPFSDPAGVLSHSVRQSGPIIFGTGSGAPELAATDADGNPLEIVSLEEIQTAARTGAAAGTAATAAGLGVFARPAPDSAVPTLVLPSPFGAPQVAAAEPPAIPPHPPRGVQDAHVVAWLTATAPQRETATPLPRAARAELQRRLVMMHFLPERRIDGALDADTRTAVSLAQGAFGQAPTGFVDSVFLRELERRSADLWTDWERENARVRVVAKRPAAAPDATLPPAEREGCRRDGTGRIIAEQSFGCDLRGVGEGIQRFFAKLEVTPDSPDRLRPAGLER